MIKAFRPNWHYALRPLSQNVIVRLVFIMFLCFGVGGEEQRNLDQATAGCDEAKKKLFATYGESRNFAKHKILFSTT